MGKGFNHNLAKEKMIPISKKMPLCGKKEEELKHILIHCPPIWVQWIDLLSAFGDS